MIFALHKYLTGTDNVICVGSNFPAKLHISNVPGNITPNELKASTSTESAFKLIESSNCNEYLQGINIASTDVYNADAILACYVLVYTEQAVKIREPLINIARTGIFKEFTNDDGLKAAKVIEMYYDPGKSPNKGPFENLDYLAIIKKLYEQVFGILPDLVSNIDKYENLWKEDFEWFRRSEQLFESQQSVFSNYNDIRLSVLESNSIIHPVVKNMQAEYEIILSSVKSKEGNLFKLNYKPVTWYDTPHKNRINRENLETLTDKLNQIEKSKKGIWKVFGDSPEKEPEYGLQFSDERFNLVESKIEVFEIENILFEFLD